MLKLIIKINLTEDIYIKLKFFLYYKYSYNNMQNKNLHL